MERTVNRTVNNDETLDNRTFNENPQNEESNTNRTVNRTANEILQTLPEFCTILYKEIKKRPNSSYQEFAKILVKEEQPFQKRYRFLKITASFPAKAPPNLVTG